MARQPFSIRKFLGLDNKDAPESLASFGERGASRIGETYAQKATNVDFDDDFGVTRRQGWSLDQSGRFHSLWNSPDGSMVFAVKDYMLGTLDADRVHTPLLAAGDAPFSYADTGAGIYLSNGLNIAVYTSGALTELGRGGTYDPTSTVVDPAEDDVIWDAPPAGYLLVWMFGRLWSINEYGAYYSQGYRPDLFNLADDFIDLPDIAMLAPTASGYYIGTDSEVFYISGSNPKQPTPTKQCCDFGVFPRSAAVLPASQFGPANSSKDTVVVWESPRGKVLGKDGGGVELLTDEHVAYPSSATSAATLLREINGEVHHIAALAQPSTDGSNFRTTDVAVAEVVRNGISI